ncbi:N-acetylmuramoyl-L-alanine amidase [Levyella massiliensis]|jgi:hypothetical protein|uniref:N-acetylmuramoyl-L-alanine amidase n=1 Tax=Levyella massiliensis TaxID=938289 RepID=UPI003EBDC16B
MVKILLDPGHGAGRAFNRGSVISNEGDNNYAYSLVLTKALRARGFIVGTTRPTSGSNPSLSQRGKMGAGFDLFISLHSNAAGSSVRGTEIWNSVKSPVPAKLASSLCASLAGVFGHRNRGVKYRKLGWTDWYGVLRSNRATYGMLIEHGFHTNQRDCWTYVNRREELAKATADILADWYGLSGSVPQASASSTSSTSSTAKQGPSAPCPGVVFEKYENWHFTPSCTTNVRVLPSTSSQVVAQYGPGERVNYDEVYVGNGYVWLSYIGRSGNRRYVACRPYHNGVKGKAWGSF